MRRAYILLITIASALLSASVALAAPSTPATLGTQSLVSTPSAETSATRLADLNRSVVAIAYGKDRVGSGVVVGQNLVLTSLNVYDERRQGGAVMTADGEPQFFRVVAKDEELKLLLLWAELPDVKPVTWGKGATLRAGDPVTALGQPETVREVVRLPGHIKSPAIAMMGNHVATDIPIDPLVEGGPLVDPAGRIAGIIVSQSFGLSNTNVGVAVVAEAARQMVNDVAKAREKENAEAAAEVVHRWIARIVLLGIIAALIAFFAWFGRWYRRMEAREAAEEAAGREAFHGTDPREGAFE